MAKRTLQQSRTFFKRNTTNRGNGRELYLTPHIYIHKIVSSLLILKPFLKDYTWVDPCAGDGRWAKVIRNNFGIDCISFDIEPLTKDVGKMDFLDCQLPMDKKYFFIGNPPYSLLKVFVAKSLSITDYCYFLGGSQIITGTLSDKIELLHRFEGAEGNQKDKRTKLSFIDTSNKNVLVWTCGGLFSNKANRFFQQSESLNESSFSVSVKRYCIEDNRVYTIKVA